MLPVVGRRDPAAGTILEAAVMKLNEGGVLSIASVRRVDTKESETGSPTPDETRPASYFKGEIMKLNQDHIGRVIENIENKGHGRRVLSAVGGDFIWTITFLGEYLTELNEGWELVEEPKKPSAQIIKKLLPFTTGINPVENAIMEWLDENWPPK